MRDWLPAHHLARFVVEIIDQLDLKAMVRAYGSRGSAAFHPALLLSILVYGYATGIFSSRRPANKVAHLGYDSFGIASVVARLAGRANIVYCNILFSTLQCYKLLINFRSLAS